MSLTSREDRLRSEGDSNTATREQELRAALLESNARYEKLIQQQRQDIASLTAAVNKANESHVRELRGVLTQEVDRSLKPLSDGAQQGVKAINRIIAGARSNAWWSRIVLVGFVLWTAAAVGVGYWLGGGGTRMQRIEWNTAHPEQRIDITADKDVLDKAYEAQQQQVLQQKGQGQTK